MAIYQGDVLLSKGGTPTAMLESNTKSAQKFWRGSKAEFDAIELKDPNTMYIVTDNNTSDNTSDILTTTLNNHINDIESHITPEERVSWNEKASVEYVDGKVFASSNEINNKINNHNTSDTSHNDIRILLNDLTARLNTVANSSEEELDQLAEIVAYIKSNKELIDVITTSKISIDDIVADLTTNLDNKVLSASQGVILKGLIDNIISNEEVLRTDIDNHINNENIHITLEDKENWNNKVSGINENLLINADFRDFIAQNGVEKYPIGIQNFGYVWNKSSNDSFLIKGEDCWTFTTDASIGKYGFIQQVFNKENGLANFYGKTLTLSLIYKNLTSAPANIMFILMNASNEHIYSYGIRLTSNSSILNLSSLTKTIPNDSNIQKMCVRFGFINPESINIDSIDLIAMKLELGDKQTLAHQDENDNWILNEAPNRAKQLALCGQYNPETNTFKDSPVITEKDIQYYSNENLLRNWYFGNSDTLIDSKGGYLIPPNVVMYENTDFNSENTYTPKEYIQATEVTSTYCSYKINDKIWYANKSECVRGYITPREVFDGWSFNRPTNGTPGIVIINQDCLEFIPNKNNRTYLNYRLPFLKDYKNLINSKLTISILYSSKNSNINLYSTCAIKNSNNNISYNTVAEKIFFPSGEENIIQLGTLTFTVPSIDNIENLHLYEPISISILSNTNESPSNIKVYAVKAELGDKQTLAHQDENGNWVLNEIPTRAEQMALCSQYDFNTNKFKDSPFITELDLQNSQLQNNVNNHISNEDIHVDIGDKENWNNKVDANYVKEQIDAIPVPDVSGQIGEHNIAPDSHNDIRLLVKSIKEKLDNLVDSGENLDQISEVVKLIEDSDSDILQQLTNKVNITDIVNNLTTNTTNVPLSAAQGVALKSAIDNINIPTKVSDLTNDKGYLTSYTETDPTVPSWAKQTNKPTYTASEVGADASGTASNLINSHNSNTSAHSDIRTLVNTAQSTANTASTNANAAITAVNNMYDMVNKGWQCVEIIPFKVDEYTTLASGNTIKITLPTVIQPYLYTYEFKITFFGVQCYGSTASGNVKPVAFNVYLSNGNVNSSSVSFNPTESSYSSHLSWPSIIEKTVMTSYNSAGSYYTKILGSVIGTNTDSMSWSNGEFFTYPNYNYNQIVLKSNFSAAETLGARFEYRVVGTK